MKLAKSIQDWFKRTEKELRKELALANQKAKYWEDQYENAKKYIEDMHDEVHSYEDNS